MLRALTEQPREQLALGELVQTFGDRSFGVLMFVFAVPNLLPLLPPGSSAVFGLPLIVISVQLAIGRQFLWLPDVLARQVVRRSDLKRIFDYVLPWLRRLERLLSPRLTFLFGPVGDRAVGVVCLLMAAVLFLPIPFVNFVPALAIALFALALLQQDGLLVLVALFVTLGAITILISVSRALWLAIAAFFVALPLF